MGKDVNQLGNIYIFYLVVALAILGILFYSFKIKNSSNPSPTPTPSPSASANLNVKTPQQSSPKASPSPTVTPSPTPTPTLSPTNSLSASVSVSPSCSESHDGLGKHMDAVVKFENLDKLNSNDLIVTTIDTQTQNRSDSHVSTILINNQSITMHRYVLAFQGSTVPLELFPDGRQYLVKIAKAIYKSDGTIDVYQENVLSSSFSKKCDF